MKILAIHADYLRFEPTGKAIEAAQQAEKAKESVQECLVVFMAVEKADEGQRDGVVAELVREAASIAEQVKTQRIVLYPYAHLSSELASPKAAVEIMDAAEQALGAEGFEVSHAPFGWYKAFEISCKGHPLSELSRSITVKKTGDDTTTQALKDEQTLKSEWFILDPKGELVPITKYDFKGAENLRKLCAYETEKDRSAPREPHHVKMMRKLEIADYEPGSDSGNMRYYPKGRLIKKLLETYVTDQVVAYGGMEVESPIMYDMEHPSLSRYLQRFPARQYRIESDKRRFFLRFAACFGQFLIAHDATISYRHLPLRIYELTRYSFRHEQRGELTGLRRLRAFTMPDVHAMCQDMVQALNEYERRFDLCLRVCEGIGLSRDEFEMAIRVTRPFYDEHKDFLSLLIRRLGKPVLVEIWAERKFYFELKYEFNFIDANEKASALATDQVDVENAERYAITFNDREGKQRHPLILHCSPSGAIERVIYALLERTYFQQQRGEASQLPLWLAPTQVRLIPVSPSQHLARCEEWARSLSRVRVDIDDQEESIAKRIRRAEQEWVPFVVVVGEKELAAQQVSVRVRGEQEQQQMSIDALAQLIGERTAGMPWSPLPLPQRLSRRPIFVG